MSPSEPNFTRGGQRPDSPKHVALLDKCPTCGDATIFGYGLAGGGFGAYVLCLSCDFFAKNYEDDPRTSSASSPSACP